MKITLEQWQTLVAVVDRGGYARAAEALGKSQSAVSYAIARLEEHLGLAVFRIEGRRAQLTEAGRAPLPTGPDPAGKRTSHGGAGGPLPQGR